MFSFIFSVRQPVRILLVLIYSLCIAALSLLPMHDFPEVPKFRGFDKVVHFSMYFIFSVLLSWAIKTELKYSRLLIISALTIGWGLFMEFLQYSMHLGRSFSWYDMFANALGVFLGLLFFVLLSKFSTPEITRKSR
jgi:VanZ family protein